mgnify:CR=1 FL=1
MVARKDRHVLDGEVEFFEKIVGVAYGFLFKVTAKRKIAEHFEERQVRLIPHLINIRCAEALLDRGHIPRTEVPHRVGLAGVVLLELLHSGRGQQDRGIIGNQRRRGHDRVAACGKELEEALADFR